MKRFLELLILILFMFTIVGCTKEVPEEVDKPETYEEIKEVVHHKVIFVANEGGYISGTEVQDVEEGKSSNVVKAIANEGYEFVSWNDGVKDEKRIINNVTKDVSLVANFRKIIYEYPTIFIVTEGNKAITSKETYLNCTVTVDDNKNPEYNLTRVEAKIKGRGNSTWDKPKKPYRIKFNQKVDLFGNGANKDWTLIANYVDPSLIRNFLAYSIAYSFDDVPYTTSMQYASVYVNGAYQGLYLICEQIEVGKNHVEINDDIDNQISFLLELDKRILDEGKTEGLDYFYAEGQPYGIKAPKTDGDNFNKSECTRIKNYIQFCIDTIKNKSFEEVKKCLDVDSFADGYIIHELFSSIDVNFSSWYISKDKGEKVKNGPIWDFDISAGNVDYNDQARFADRLFANTNTWYKYLLKHQEFKDLVKEKLTKYYDIIHMVVEEKIEEVMLYKPYFLENFTKWKILGKYGWPNPPEIVAITTWEGHVEFVRDWLYAKLDFMMKTYCK